MGGSSVLPVHRDGAEVEDGCGAAHDVERDPNVAKLVAENPVSLQVVGYGEDHHQTGDKEVADGQRDDEQVAHFPQRPVSIDIRLQKKINFRQPICPSHLPICVDGDADQQVTGDGQEDDHSQEKAFEIVSNKFFRYQKMLEMDNRVSTQTEVKFALGRGY